MNYNIKSEIFFYDNYSNYITVFIKPYTVIIYRILYKYTIYLNIS